jgi:hypothetical protein
MSDLYSSWTDHQENTVSDSSTVAWHHRNRPQRKQQFLPFLRCLATVVNRRFHCWLLTYSMHVTLSYKSQNAALGSKFSLKSGPRLASLVQCEDAVDLYIYHTSAYTNMKNTDMRLEGCTQLTTQSHNNIYCLHPVDGSMTHPSSRNKFLKN